MFGQLTMEPTLPFVLSHTLHFSTRIFFMLTQPKINVATPAVVMFRQLTMIGLIAMA